MFLMASRSIILLTEAIIWGSFSASMRQSLKSLGSNCSELMVLKCFTEMYCIHYLQINRTAGGGGGGGGGRLLRSEVVLTEASSPVLDWGRWTMTINKWFGDELATSHCPNRKWLNWRMHVWISSLHRVNQNEAQKSSRLVSKFKAMNLRRACALENDMVIFFGLYLNLFYSTHHRDMFCRIIGNTISDRKHLSLLSM